MAQSVNVTIYKPLVIMGNQAADIWLRHGFMTKAHALMGEKFKIHNQTNIAKLLDNKHLTMPMSHALFVRIPLNLRSVASGILAGGRKPEVRSEIDGWVDDVLKVLDEYVMFAGRQMSNDTYIEKVTRRKPLAEDYMSSFHDHQYIPLWAVVSENGSLSASTF
jgi:hypothetical protein